MSFISSTGNRTHDLALNGCGVPIFFLAGFRKLVPAELRKRDAAPSNAHKPELRVGGPVVPVTIELLRRAVGFNVILDPSGVVLYHPEDAVVRKLQTSDAVKCRGTSWD